MMKDHEFVSWMADRMVHVYGESPNVDFVHRARAIAENIARYDLSADAFESLRARLAKYEDAEGRPVVALPDPYGWVAAGGFYTDREAAISAAGKTPCIDVYSRPQMDVSEDRSLQRQAVAEYLAKELDSACAEIRALKAQPSGVDERSAFEAWRLEKFCGGVERLKKCSNAPDVYFYTAEQEAWKVWQARAALSAPSHGEQVEEIARLRDLLTAWRRMFDGGIASGELGVLRGQTDAALAKP